MSTNVKVVRTAFSVPGVDPVCREAMVVNAIGKKTQDKC